MDQKQVPQITFDIIQQNLNTYMLYLHSSVCHIFFECSLSIHILTRAFTIRIYKVCTMSVHTNEDSSPLDTSTWAFKGGFHARIQKILSEGAQL